MHPFNRPHIRVRQQGQTLIIALIVLGVLLILGLVFLGLINRNIVNASRSQRRSESYDLAVAGVTYAHSQLVSSPLGADWRGVPTDFGTATVSGDPDAYYLRPKSGLTVKDPSDPTGTARVSDLGGPDMLGPFIRIPFPGGRSLTRVRYGATDATATKLVPGGPLRNPGAARSTLIIESVGRTGVVNTNDPTTLNAAGGLQVNGFADANALAAGIAALAQADAQLPTSRRIVAYARIGIIDAARFETNVFNSSAPIELGIADGLGIHAYNDANLPNPTNGLDPTDVGANLETQIGSPDAILSRPDRPFGFGSLIINGDLQVHGQLHVYANQTLGDTIRVAGRVSEGTAGASIQVTPIKANATGTGYTATPTPLLLTEGGGTGTNGSFDSQSPNFNTAGGILLDGSPRTDNSGYASGVGILVPPSTQTVDPQTRLNRYVALTRETGLALNAATQQNTGAFGHGSGVYVDNAADRQEPADDNGRRITGSQRSLFDDWLNPNSGAADSGWRGPFYTPVGAAVQLLPDGFVIQRDGAAATEKTWKYPDGTDSGRTTIRYRLGKVGNQVFIVDTLTPNVGDINGAGATGPDFTKGVPFNGVLYFEGNVRVRGTIPTAAQLTLVSGATIYIEGSITKGVLNNDLTGGNRGDVISGLPSASLMLMAKDNVAVNTTMFFGPTAGQTLESVNDVSGATNVSPVRIRAADKEGLELNLDLALDPNTTPTSSLAPSMWKPYATTYRDWQGGAPVPTSLVLADTMDDGTASASFLQIDVNDGVGGQVGSPPRNASQYQFSTQYNTANPNLNGLWDNFIVNTAATYLSIDPNVTLSTDLYGLGAEPWQRYSKFETRSFPLVPNPANTTYSANGGTIGQTGIDYSLLSSGNDLRIAPRAISGVSTNDILVGRVAVTPSEARIEASIFAEQGSFFVIPGPWFNPNPNDTHDAYWQNYGGVAANKARADRIRLEAYGNGPGAPFYGEPLDVRLSIVGSVAENLPPPIAVQSEWIRKWGWIPRRLSATGIGIPGAHVPTGYPIANRNFVPNLVIQYDPILATGRLNDPGNPNLIRADAQGRPLPPMPRLPVSPKLAYFGEIQ